MGKNTKNLFVIKIHSLIDVITNSSSELFICNTEKTLKTVKEFLVLSCGSIGYDFSNCFKEPYQLVSDDNIEKYLIEYGDWFTDVKYDYKSDEPWNIRSVKYNKEYKAWLDKELGKNIENYRNRIIIESLDDNSVPYELWDIIEKELSAERYHLG